MSGDLISRSALLEKINNLHPNWHLETMGFLAKAVIEEVTEIVQNEPVAYDVDKVVEKLQHPTNYTIVYGKHITTVDRSVEIVKAGGVE